MARSVAEADGPYLLGIDFGTESVRVGIFDTHGQPRSFAATTYKPTHPRPGWAEQQPDDWWSAMVSSTRQAIERAGIAADAIAGIGVDATACTLVALDASNRLLRPAIMWMDARAAPQALRIGKSTHPARRVNGGGPVSAEWLPPKALWLKERQNDIYQRTAHLVECVDWVTFRLTGRWTANINTATIKGFYDRDQGGWPTDFYDEFDLGDVFDKLPADVLDLGVAVEGLSRAVADELGLKAGTPVAQGGADAYIAQIGMGVVQPGKMAMITGSSHVHIAQSDHATSGNGFFGAFTDALVPGQYSVEGGQISTGSVLEWFKDNFCKDAIEEAERRGVSAYDVRNEQARQVPLGSDGLIVCDYWQGNRTPYVDAEARGIIWGLTLSHTPAHIYRAIQEGVCYGTAHILRVMYDAGVDVTQLVAAGGIANSRDWIHMHADVTGIPVTLTKVGDAAVLGSAMLGAVGAGTYRDVQQAADAMVQETDVVEPDRDRHERYQFYVDAYTDTYPQPRGLVQAMTRHIGRSESQQEELPIG